ncbi:hypothetical protein Tco_0427106, partial [Tanacetum coccineum]
MLVIQAVEGEGSGHPFEPQPPPSTTQPTNKEPIPAVVSSSHQKTQTPRQALKEVIELPQMRLSMRSGMTEWKGLPLLLLAYMQYRLVVTSLRPNPRQYLMCLFLRKLVQ